MNAQELMHYGVKGMKWGVKRGKVEQAYTRASKKADKLHAKIDKARVRSEKMSAKADKKMSSKFGSAEKKLKSVVKAKKAAASYRKAIRKASKWNEAMKETFANTSVKMTSQQVARGKQYLNALNMDAFIR